MDSILRFDNPFQTRLLSYAALIGLGDLYLIAKELIYIKNEKQYKKVLNRFVVEIELKVSKGSNRWSLGYRKIIKEEAQTMFCKNILN